MFITIKKKQDSQICFHTIDSHLKLSIWSMLAFFEVGIGLPFGMFWLLKWWFDYSCQGGSRCLRLPIDTCPWLQLHLWVAALGGLGWSLAWNFQPATTPYLLVLRVFIKDYTSFTQQMSFLPLIIRDNYVSYIIIIFNIKTFNINYYKCFI